MEVMVSHVSLACERNFINVWISVQIRLTESLLFLVSFSFLSPTLASRNVSHHDRLSPASGTHHHGMTDDRDCRWGRLKREERKSRSKLRRNEWISSQDDRLWSLSHLMSVTADLFSWEEMSEGCCCSVCRFLYTSGTRSTDHLNLDQGYRFVCLSFSDLCYYRDMKVRQAFIRVMK